MAAHVLTPTAFYKDPKAMMAWLREAFGFEVDILLEDRDGAIAHLEMSYRGAPIGVGGEWQGPQLGSAAMRSPRSLDGANSQFIWLYVESGIDEACERARKAGAKIVQEPEEQFYGARTFRALDPEGHVWCFSQTTRVVSPEEQEKATGLVYRKA
jgi:uncharacterized glyoxalase superfamily protein PhnB